MKMLIPQSNGKCIMYTVNQHAVSLMRCIDTDVSPFTSHFEMQVEILNCACVVVLFFLSANTSPE